MIEGKNRRARCTCVTFDLWETLLIDEPCKDRLRREMRCKGIRRILSQFGLELPLEDLLRGHDQSADFLQTSWRVNKDPSTLDQIRYIVKVASKQTTDLLENHTVTQELEEAYISPLFSVPPILNDDVVSTLEGMHDRGYKIGLVSNVGRSSGRALRQLLCQLGILNHFDTIVFSDEVGWRKPDRRIFMAVAQRLGAVTACVVHIGDDPERDVWGGKEAGMRAILFEYEVPEEFKKEPRSLFALSRATRSVKNSKVMPDGRIGSLRDALEVVDSLR